MEKISERLLSWASILDEKTLDQARVSATLPFIHPHIALMPDAHLGRGATVGSVIPTRGAIVPSAVGVDIGCGMIAVKTGFVIDDLPADRAAMRQAIERAIPLSAGNNNARLVASAAPRVAELRMLAEELGVDPDSHASNWPRQVGTLGSGNHFIELCADESDVVWLFLHSGSRGVGNRIAQHHIRVAQDLCAKYWVRLPDPELAFLAEGTPEFDAYLADLRWAQHFALLNREEMMDRVIRQLAEWVGREVVEQERINCHHNFTEKEHHFGQDLWITRKGAIRADAGRPGLIPGSMGTASYVVSGLGDAASMRSAPHGAGREYSRTAARKAFTLEQLREAMTGIEFREDEMFIDEIPQAYKPIDRVMADAASLVEVRHTLRQLINVKGD